MDENTNNKVNYYLFINSVIGVTIFILFVLAHALKSISLAYLTSLIALFNIVLIVYYYQYALSYRNSLKDFGRVKRQSFFRLISAIGFIILSVVMIIVYT